MSNGEATDQTKDDAQRQSYGCPYCSGAGMCEVFHKRYTGSRTVEVESVVRGEIRMVKTPAIVAAHCVCAMGRWMRGKTDREMLRRIPDLADILAGQSRWLAGDPTGERVYTAPRGGVRAMVQGLVGR